MKWASVCLVLLAVPLSGEARAQSADTWITAEALVWWAKNGPAPVPLATTAPAASPALFAGALGNPDTTVVLGGSSIDHPVQVGGRFTIGHWLAGDSSLGFEANYLFLAKTSESRTIGVNGPDILATPFFDAAPTVQLPNANYLAASGPPNNGTATLASSHLLQGGELNGLWKLSEGTDSTWSLLAGYRSLHVAEELTFTTTQVDNFNFFPGQFVNTFDQFETKNYFNGGQIGLRGEWSYGCWFFGSTVKVAIGDSHQVLRVRGTSTTNTGLNYLTQIPVTTVPGGVYAQPTNIGDYERDRFAVLPEVSLRLGLQVSQHVRTFVGYNFMYLSSVARPGNQIDGTINSTQLVSFTGVPTGPLVGEPRPAPIFESTDYWVQGANFGLEFAW